MLIPCDQCGKEHNRPTYKIKKVNYCSKQCRFDATRVVMPCAMCGTVVTRWKSENSETLLCSKACISAWRSQRMSGMNVELNPERMTIETRTKLREAHLNTGEGKTYEKTFQVHTHRVVAEAKLGRPLLPGEVVHHIDNNHRNNSPENLWVFDSQAEHARWHMLIR